MWFRLEEADVKMKEEAGMTPGFLSLRDEKLEQNKSTGYCISIALSYLCEARGSRPQVEKNGKTNNTTKEQNLINTMLLPPKTALAPENLASLEYGCFKIYINILIHMLEFLHMRFSLCEAFVPPHFLCEQNHTGHLPFSIHSV